MGFNVALTPEPTRIENLEVGQRYELQNQTSRAIRMEVTDTPVTASDAPHKLILAYTDQGFKLTGEEQAYVWTSGAQDGIAFVAERA